MFKRIFVLAVFGLFLGFSTAFAATLELPRTGQTLCYDATGATAACSGTGQDGEYQLGVAWPNPRFTPVPGFEAVCITDNLTGLVWATSSDITHTTWQGALDYANNLVRCGQSDWRLPNINEMFSLIHTGEITTSAWLNAQGFSGLVPSLYWTSSTRADNVRDAWMVSLWNGNPPPGVKTVSGSHYALPVRGSTSGPTPVWETGRTTCYDENGTVRNCAGTGEDAEYQEGVAWPNPRFVIGSGSEADCITDQLTDLMWLRTPNITTTVTWQDALAAANNLSACGHSDWRLPNWNEFRSLANYSQSTLSEWLKNPAQGFTGVTGGYYWSSTTKLATTSQPVASQAWVFSATTSAEEGFAKTDTGVPHGAWAVRGPASVTPLPNIIVDPTVINFGFVLVNNPSVARTVTIRNGGTVNLEVNSTSTTSGLFTVTTGGTSPCTDTTPTLTPGQSCTLVVTFTPTALGLQSATLDIASNDPDTAIVQVSLTGTGTDVIAPNIVVDPTAINFGSFLVNQPSSQTLTISSQGTADLVISQTTLTGTSSAMFSVAPGGTSPCASTTPTILYGTSCTLAITFTPTGSGAHEAYFNITSNDPDTSLVTVALSGTGIGNDVTPSATEGTYGTEITYEGAPSGFGDKKGKVYIDNLKQKVISWSNTSVKVIVKKVKDLLTDTPFNVSIQWKPKGSKTTNTIDLPGAFTLKKPELSEATYSGSPEQEITITGMWFGTKKGKVYVNQQKCKVTEWRMDPETGVSTLKFVVNKKLFAATYGLEVENKIGRAAAIFTVN